MTADQWKQIRNNLVNAMDPRNYGKFGPAEFHALWNNILQLDAHFAQVFQAPIIDEKDLKPA
jgi:hypothetical protein